MSTLQHSAHGYILGFLAIHSFLLAIPFALVAAIPDILGWYGNLIRKDNWELYNLVHGKRPILLICISLLCYCVVALKTISFVIVMVHLSIIVHLLIDIFWHNPNPPYGWYSWGKRGEIIGAIITLILALGVMV